MARRLTAELRLEARSRPSFNFAIIKKHDQRTSSQLDESDPTCPNAEVKSLFESLLSKGIFT